MNAPVNTSNNFDLWLNDNGLDKNMWSALKNSIFPGAKDESIVMAVAYAKARKLDIMKKPCHIVPMNVKDSQTGNMQWRDVIMPSITEQRITANRTGQYAGQDAPMFGEMVEIRFGSSMHTVPEFCTVTVYRMIHGEKVGFSQTEFFEEACSTTKNGDLNSMWTKRKRGQLAKCAEAGALRKAFPEEIGNEYTVEEMDGKIIDVGGSVSVEDTNRAENNVPDGYHEFEQENLQKFRNSASNGTQTLLDMHATLPKGDVLAKHFWRTHSEDFKAIAELADQNIAENTDDYSTAQ